MEWNGNIEIASPKSSSTSPKSASIEESNSENEVDFSSKMLIMSVG